MEIERLPIIRDLEDFAESLPREHRARLFKTAEAFLNVGAMHGAFAGMAGAMGTTSKGNKQEDYLKYLSSKAQEYSR